MSIVIKGKFRVTELTVSSQIAAFVVALSVLAPIKIARATGRPAY
jgi:hypothetical protein